MRSVCLLRPLPAARGAGIALPASIVAAFAVFGVLLSLWVMIAYHPLGALDFRSGLAHAIDCRGGFEFHLGQQLGLLQTRARSFTAVARVHLSPLYARTREGSQPINVAMVSRIWICSRLKSYVGELSRIVTSHGLATAPRES